MAKKARLKVFGVNLDGRHRGIVAATSQKEAARLLGVSLSMVRVHGCETGNAAEIERAIAEPGRAWQARHDARAEDADAWEPIPPPDAPPSIVDAFRQLASASRGRWEGVDAIEYVRELREN